VVFFLLSVNNDNFETNAKNITGKDKSLCNNCYRDIKEQQHGKCRSECAANSICRLGWGGSSLSWNRCYQKFKFSRHLHRSKFFKETNRQTFDKFKILIFIKRYLVRKSIAKIRNSQSNLADMFSACFLWASILLNFNCSFFGEADTFLILSYSL
jgi:hypothetical protein